MSNSQSSTKPRATYALTGHSLIGDPRTTPIRGDLADIKLAGKLFAPHYAVPLVKSCILPATTLHEGPHESDEGTSRLLHGEEFAVLDIAGNWAWGYGVHDDYLGYLRFSALGDMGDPTHIVTGSGALIVAAPKVPSPLIKRLPMGARLSCGMITECGRYLTCGDGFVPLKHVVAIGDVSVDPVELALGLVGTPYLWGGRSGDAIDCSGLVQLCFALAGHDVPRDADMQEADFGKMLDDGDPLGRGDLVFFPGHVGIMVDEANIVHANSHHMKVSVESLADVTSRFDDGENGPVTARKRV
ncbi:MAG: C40 family peptidase [Sphingorhabdus sp.]